MLWLERVPDNTKNFNGIELPLYSGAGRMCFGVRLGCISKPEQTSQTETMKHVETFLDCFGNQFYVIPWFKLFRSPFYRRYEKSADYLKRFQFILDNKD